MSMNSGGTALDRMLPMPRLMEVDHVDLAVGPAEAWERVRHGNLGASPLIRALFAIRTLPNRWSGKPADVGEFRIDDMVSTPERPGFQVLVDDPPHEVVVGAIGKVWVPDIPFLHMRSAGEYHDFAEPDWIKVAWAVRVLPLGERDSRVEIEVRVDGTDEASWSRFRQYFRLIGPGSRLIRLIALRALAREMGSAESAALERPLPGDELLPDAEGEFTHGITIAAKPEAIWPWLVQMGGHRAGFYSYDLLDNAGERSAREIHPELQEIQVGQVLPATRDSAEGFEVLRIDAPRVLILGGLWDVETETQQAFASARPERFWQMTWAFVLEPLDEGETRLTVRVRGAFSKEGRFHASWIRPVHHFMQTAQLRHLKERAEARLPRDDFRDVLEGAGGAAVMAAAFLSPFLGEARSHWGVEASLAAQRWPGDELVPKPRWGWTHGIEIDAAPGEVWPWIAQIGADRGGFYSYQWLENVVGCGVSNAEAIHPEWEVEVGSAFRLHPKMPALRVVEVKRGEYFVVHGAPEGKAWVEASWLFLVEPVGEGRSRFISRYRIATSDDLATRLQYGAALVEPIGFAMDRRMLLGVKERVERGRN